MYKYIYICKHVYKYTFMYIYICKYMYIYIYIFQRAKLTKTHGRTQTLGAIGKPRQRSAVPPAPTYKSEVNTIHVYSIYIYVYAYMYIYIYICMYVCVHIYIYVCIYICIYICIFKYENE